MDVRVKDSVRVAYGREGARRRWGDQPRAVRLDAFRPEERAIILGLWELAKARETSPDPGK